MKYGEPILLERKMRILRLCTMRRVKRGNGKEMNLMAVLNYPDMAMFNTLTMPRFTHI